jgi:hypothetical protein
LPWEADDKRAFYRQMEAIAKNLDRWLETARATRVLSLPEPAYLVPEDLDAHLWEVIGEKGNPPAGDALRLVIMAAAGGIDQLCVLVEPKTAGEGFQRSIVAQWRTRLPDHAAVWINDANATRQELEALIGRQVQDRTPEGWLERKWPVLQIPRDVTKRTSPRRAAEVLRGILYDLPDKRVGVITHQRLVDPLPDQLGDEFSRRVAKIEYFHGGESRGSNDWVGRCDALVVLGTPRVPPEAVRSHLYRLGKLRATILDLEAAGWAADWWSGVTESGRRRTVKTLYYRDHDWHEAYCPLVVRELRQALGRARSILAEGMPVYLVTTEELGETLADAPFTPLTEVQTRVLNRMRDAGGVRVLCTAPVIARSLRLTRQRVRNVLAELFKSRRVRRAGKKWVACRRGAGF